MLSLLLSFTLQTTHASATWHCAQALHAPTDHDREMNRYFAAALARLAHSRRRYGIPVLRAVEAARPGQIVLVNAANAAPSIGWSLRFNTRAAHYPGWRFVAFDYNQD